MSFINKRLSSELDSDDDSDSENSSIEETQKSFKAKKELVYLEFLNSMNTIRQQIDPNESLIYKSRVGIVARLGLMNRKLGKLGLSRAELRILKDSSEYDYVPTVANVNNTSHEQCEESESSTSSDKIRKKDDGEVKSLSAAN